MNEQLDGALDGLDGLVVFVANGADGVGALLSRYLLDNGATVAVGYRHGRGEVDTLLAEYPRGRLSVHQGAMTSPDDCARTLQDAAKEHGRLDALVTIVGSAYPSSVGTSRSLLGATPREWDRHIQATLTGIFHLTRAAIDQLGGCGGGRIVNVLGLSSIGGSTGRPSTWLRQAIAGLIRDFALEAARYHVTVNAVAPGILDDETLDVLPGLREEATATVPVRRLAHADDIARAVRFFLEPAADYLTGQLLDVDGGLRT